ncbi:MAG: hypothetical protein K1X82_10075 [Bacteroidia bacterium]|nr:hypothetical protein [Bacteroidia bacterium]
MNKTLGLLLLVFVFFSSCKKDDKTFSLVSPGNGSQNIDATQPFTCDSWPNAILYNYTFTNQETQNSLYRTSVSNSLTLSPSDLVPGAPYTWSVNVTTSDGNNFSSPTWSFSVASGGNGVIPSLISPDNYITGITTRPTLSWSSVYGATSYDITISKYGDMSTIVLNQAVNGTTFTVPPGTLENDYTYFWRVNVTGTTNFSSVRQFSTASPPTLLTPTDGSTVQTTFPTFTWSGFPGATTYKLEISTSSSFSTLARSKVVTGTTYTLDAGEYLYSGNYYYWRVKVDGDLEYSYVSNFSVN